jgi:hypothetical protein
MDRLSETWAVCHYRRRRSIPFRKNQFLHLRSLQAVNLLQLGEIDNDLAQVLLSLRAYITYPGIEAGQCHDGLFQARQEGKGAR